MMTITRRTVSGAGPGRTLLAHGHPRYPGLLQELGLTRNELAGRLGVSPHTVKGWVAGDHLPTRRVLTKIERLIEYREEDKALTLTR
jgi:DNA-binding XRE family transcriptional regulator